MLPLAAAEHYRRRQRLTVTTVAATRRAWDRMRPGVDPGGNLDALYAEVAPSLALLDSAAQTAALREADAYLAQVLAELGLDDDPVARVDPSAFVGVAGDGRPVDSLMRESVVTTKTALGAGQSPSTAFARGQAFLDTATRTLVADTTRAAIAVGMTARPTITGYVRMLNPPSCGRCLVLAGRWYRYDAGFNRHPRCDCTQIPAPKTLAPDLVTNPSRYFDSVSTAEQDRMLGRPGAEAVRLGADLSSVVNARRGMQTVGITQTRINDQGQTVNVQHRTAQSRVVRGQRVLTTREATRGRGRGAGPRLMPESILAHADGDRAEALRLLRQHGYLTK